MLWKPKGAAPPQLIGDFFHSVVFTVEDETGGLECFVHAIKRAVLVGGAGELLGQLDAWIWLGRCARVACCPELLDLGFQYENPACRHVRDGLSSCSFGFRTGKLKFQVSFLHSGAVQAVAQGSDVSNVGGRGRGQSIQAACEAGELLTHGEARRVEVWKKRAALGPQEQLRVARRYWIQRSCPRCNAEQGRDCVLVEGPSSGKQRKDGHNERLQLVVDERKAARKTVRQQKKAQQEAKDPAEPMRPAPEGQAKEAGKKTAARLHHQVPRGDWYRVMCPRCHAGPGKLCDNDDRVGPGEKRQLPHDERLRRVLQSDDRIGPGEKQEGARDELQQQAVDVVPPPLARAEARPPRPRRRERETQETTGSAARTWHAKEVTCPKCQAGPNSPCVPHSPHHERVEWAKEFTRKLWG
ncbi:hypothetical protein [Streptomyces sp. NPDC014685]|uniref:zinc finger domain-containing protein n=1 Tax=Streptomyces sp. NPDC014685 TaxID=3364881 RepID=UPI0036FAA662